MIALPIVLRSSIRPELGLTDRFKKEFIWFFASLKREKKLGSPGEIDVVWKKKLETVVLARLKFGLLGKETSDETV